MRWHCPALISRLLPVSVPLLSPCSKMTKVLSAFFQLQQCFPLCLFCFPSIWATPALWLSTGCSGRDGSFPKSMVAALHGHFGPGPFKLQIYFVPHFYLYSSLHKFTHWWNSKTTAALSLLFCFPHGSYDGFWTFGIWCLPVFFQWLGCLCPQ